MATLEEVRFRVEIGQDSSNGDMNIVDDGRDCPWKRDHARRGVVS